MGHLEHCWLNTIMYMLSIIVALAVCLMQY